MTSASPKEVVQRFNHEVIQNGIRASFDELMDPSFVNWSAPPGMPRHGESLWKTFDQVLRPALGNLTVTIHEQVCEGDKVTTRKTVSGVHRGSLLGVEATHKQVSIEVIDIVTVRNGRYVEHWGLNTLATLVAQLRTS